MKLTDAQRGVLTIAANHDEVHGSNASNPERPCLNTTVAERLASTGLLERVRWNGRVFVYRITDAGREALAE